MQVSRWHFENIRILIRKLTINMLNSLKKRKNIFTFHIISWTLFNRRRLNSHQSNPTSCLYFQYHAFWCPGDLRCQGISRHGIDQKNWNIPSLASEEFRLSYVCLILMIRFSIPGGLVSVIDIAPGYQCRCKNMPDLIQEDSNQHHELMAG